MKKPSVKAVFCVSAAILMVMIIPLPPFMLDLGQSIAARVEHVAGQLALPIAIRFNLIRRYII